MNPDAIKDGGAAYPVAMSEKNFSNQNGEPFQQGMSLRDHFAGLALPVAHDFWTRIYFPEIDPEGDEHHFSTNHAGLITNVAESSYEIADAMIIARSKPPI